MHDIVFATARQQRAAIVSGQISAQELLSAHLDQIARTNPAVNAIITLDVEGAMAHAGHIDALLARGVYPPASQFETWFPSLAHTPEQIDQTIEIAAAAFAEIA